MVGVGMPGRHFLPHGRVQQSAPPLLQRRKGVPIKGWHNVSKGPTGCLRRVPGRCPQGLCWSHHFGNLSGFRGHPQGVFGARILGISMRALGLCSGVWNVTREVGQGVCSGTLVML